MIELNRERVEEAVLGGCLLGGGGGGDMEKGRALGRLALEVGTPRLLSLDEFDDGAVLVTVSAVGAPAAEGQYCAPMHYVRALELLRAGGVRIDGLISSENGGLATVNGWFQSAVTGIPVADAPCNGRAHPMGTMGAIGLHKEKSYVSRQAAAGGNPRAGLYTEAAVAAGIAEASRLVRQVAVSAGGLVAVARNPVTAAYAKTHAAPGAVSAAIALGRKMTAALGRGPASAAPEAADFLGGDIAATGRVSSLRLETRGGFDVGTTTVEAPGGDYSLSFWNEWMTLDRRGERLATFPDLIAAVDAETGLPLPTASVKQGLRVSIVRVPKEKLLLGAGMKDPELFREAESVLGLPLLKFIF